MTSRPPQRAFFFAIVATIVLAAGGYAVYRLQRNVLPPGFAEGDGRTEAVEFDVTTRLPGRLVDILVKPGDTVQAGQPVARIDTPPLHGDAADSVLEAARGGRVNSTRARPGDLLPAGASVLTLIDPSDVQVSLALPERFAGKVAIGSDVRLLLDPTPNYVVPAQVSSLDEAAAGTSNKQAQRMLRATARINREVLAKYRAQLAPGQSGRAYVRLDPAAQWPAFLHIRLPR